MPKFNVGPVRWSHAVKLEGERFFGGFKLDFRNDETYRFDGELYSIISHVDDGWDRERISFPGARRLIQYSKRNGITSFGFISRWGGGEQAFEQSDVNFVVNSEAGSHHFFFPNGRVFLIAGGNVSLCLCEVMRDLILGTEGAKHEVSFVLVTDAVYDSRKYWPSYINGKAAPDADRFTLEDMNGKNDQFIAAYLEEKVVGKKGEFCPGQNHYGHDKVNPKNYVFELHRGGRKVKTIGKRGRVIRIVLATSARLDATVRSLKAKPARAGMAL